MSQSLVRYTDAAIDDPDRRIALTITNHLAGMEAGRAIGIYSMAISMSLRDLSAADQRTALIGICEANLMTWRNWRDESQPEPAPCASCGGAGTVLVGPGDGLSNQRDCRDCFGTGAA